MMVQPIVRSFCFVTFTHLFIAVGLVATTLGQETVDFNRDVRPLLSSVCFKCHGPDEAHRGADLRLDTQEGVATAFEGGLDSSEAWARITSADPDLVMPPPDNPIQLSNEDRETLSRWIVQGAPWQGHWAFIPPQSPDVPIEVGAPWARNPIDHFIAAKLATRGLSPSPSADPERLLRRVTLDLTGLPPTISEIDQFLAQWQVDPESAYEQAVDRLLQSPHFGERMALVWMDAARYGDSSVFHADGPRDMWPWRDWVINAYNSNMPFDQFTIEQLAGDLIPGATNEQRVATGFNRNNATTDEGGAIAEEFRVEYALDRVKTTSMVWLGLSLECAQCHNHKYDPITMDDYYRFFAFFNQASDPGMQTRGGNQSPIANVFDPLRLQTAEALKPQVPMLEQQIAARASEAEADFQTWLAESSSQVSADDLLPAGVRLHLPLDETTTDSVDAQRVGVLNGTASWEDGKHGRALKLDGGNWIAFDSAVDFERTDSFSYGAWVRPAGGAEGTAIAKMDDGSAHRGFDMLFTGGRLSVHIINTWPTNAIKVVTKNPVRADDWNHVFVVYDGSSKASGIKIYFDGVLQEWTIEQDGLSDTIKTPVPLHIGRRNPGAPFRGLIDEVRIYDRALTEVEVQSLAGADPIRPLLAIPAPERTEAQLSTLRNHYLQSIDQPYQQLSKSLSELRAQIAQNEAPISSVMVMEDVPQMRPTYVLNRGQYSSPLEDRPVEPGVISILPGMPEGAPRNRLGLAQWIVSKENPLTARVTMNRLWGMFFGEGIVRSVEDFGAQGEWPTHPELLDWLAVDFVENGWNIKRSIKQIVMSSTYRQSAASNSALQELDPQNRWLARGPRFRLTGEFIRDNALAASGLLVPKIGGPGVKPYQPPGLWAEVSLDANVRFVQDHGEALYRRAMYTYWKRSSPAPALTIFDAPTREKCALRRSRTNTPLQALVTLNDTQFVEAARALAQRSMKEGGDSIETQIEHAYRLATGVRPSERTLAILRQAYDEERAAFEAEPQRANELLAVGESPRDEALDPISHAAMTIITSMILNLDETLTRG